MFAQQAGECAEVLAVNGNSYNGGAQVIGHPAVEPQRMALKQEVPPLRGDRGDGRKSPFEGIAGEGHVLIGRGTKISGEISDCTLVEIQGVMEGVITADAVIIREGGGFKGTLQTDQAEVHGVLEGTVVVHELLDIRTNGHVQGDLTYGRIAIAEGWFVSGSLQTKGSLEAVAEPAPVGLTLVNGFGTHQNEQ
jgi:cytoskeletal protein CcmA (bactofilin family)